MSVHSSIGASSCERWWKCPGSVRLAASLPPQPTSDFAAEGTAAHELAEMALREGHPAAAYIGQFAKNEIEWSEEMAEHVQVYLDVITADMVKYKLTKKDLQIEHKFHLTHIDPEAFGTNDANLRKFLTKVIVYDLKYGVGTIVEVEENKQGLYYASGAAAQGDYDEVEIVIVQPRAFHKDGPVRRWTVSRAELDEFETDLKDAIADTRAPDAPLRCGDHCQKTFCPALAVCPEVKKKVQNAAMVVFDEISEAKPLVMPDPSQLTPLMLCRLLDAQPLIDAWLKAVHGYAMGLALRGEHVHGYKLVRGKEGNRKWIDEAKVVLEYKKEYGDDLYQEPKLKSPAQLEKALSEIHKVEMKQLVSQSEGRLMLVGEDDPREEVAASASAAFDDVKESSMIQ